MWETSRSWVFGKVIRWREILWENWLKALLPKMRNIRLFLISIKIGIGILKKFLLFFLGWSLIESKPFLSNPSVRGRILWCGSFQLMENSIWLQPTFWLYLTSLNLPHSRVVGFGVWIHYQKLGTFFGCATMLAYLPGKWLIIGELIALCSALYAMRKRSLWWECKMSFFSPLIFSLLYLFGA